MLEDFKTFLIRSNALALAIGVIFGAAAGKIVTSMVEDLLMPVLGMILPGGTWDKAQFVLGSKTGADGKVTENAIKYGHFIGGVVDFVVIAFVLYLIAKNLVKEALPPAPPVTKTCPFCKEEISLEATKCKFCTADVK